VSLIFYLLVIELMHFLAAYLLIEVIILLSGVSQDH